MGASPSQIVHKRLSVSKFSKVVETHPRPLCLVDAKDARIVKVNSSFATLCGRAATDRAFYRESVFDSVLYRDKHGYLTSGEALSTFVYRIKCAVARTPNASDIIEDIPPAAVKFCCDAQRAGHARWRARVKLCFVQLEDGHVDGYHMILVVRPQVGAERRRSYSGEDALGRGFKPPPVAGVENGSDALSPALRRAVERDTLPDECFSVYPVSPPTYVYVARHSVGRRTPIYTPKGGENPAAHLTVKIGTPRPEKPVPFLTLSKSRSFSGYSATCLPPVVSRSDRAKELEPDSGARAGCEIFIPSCLIAAGLSDATWFSPGSSSAGSNGGSSSDGSCGDSPEKSPRERVASSPANLESLLEEPLEEEEESPRIGLNEKAQELRGSERLVDAEIPVLVQLRRSRDARAARPVSRRS